MSVAPHRRLQLVQTEVRELERACQSLERSVSQAGQATERSAEHLAATRKRIVAATEQCVPSADDAAIARRITDAVTTAFTAADKSLREHWQQIRDILLRALKRVTAELHEKRRVLRQLELELSQRR